MVSDLSLKAEEDRTLGLVELVVVADNHALIDRAVLAEWYSVSVLRPEHLVNKLVHNKIFVQARPKYRNRLEPAFLAELLNVMPRKVVVVSVRGGCGHAIDVHFHLTLGHVVGVVLLNRAVVYPTHKLTVDNYVLRKPVGNGHSVLCP